ncbi:putative PE-PGRS family protein PE PGRS20 [Micromonospora noduli]|uniref:PE-PGRS family protein PE PGRS20 n=1 Tax=Micromonospora noduli TaxID=709876 RepID=A0ABX9D6Z4_9ACTN|nr:hypothetical protein [Micromonospora noduli]RAO24328.1 putative PE-PGRS family protein PE PGRS20 [Micromonospora noduli]
MPPRRRPRSWLAGRLRSAAGAVQRLAGRVEPAGHLPQPSQTPEATPRRFGEPPRHWLDLVAAHAPGLLHDLDLDPSPTGNAEAGAQGGRQGESTGRVDADGADPVADARSGGSGRLGGPGRLGGSGGLGGSGRLGRSGNAGDVGGPGASGDKGPTRSRAEGRTGRSGRSSRAGDQPDGTGTGAAGDRTPSSSSDLTTLPGGSTWPDPSIPPAGSTWPAGPGAAVPPVGRAPRGDTTALDSPASDTTAVDASGLARTDGPRQPVRSMVFGPHSSPSGRPHQAEAEATRTTSHPQVDTRWSGEVDHGLSTGSSALRPTADRLSGGRDGFRGDSDGQPSPREDQSGRLRGDAPSATRTSPVDAVAVHRLLGGPIRGGVDASWTGSTATSAGDPSASARGDLDRLADGGPWLALPGEPAPPGHPAALRDAGTGTPGGGRATGIDGPPNAAARSVDPWPALPDDTTLWSVAGAAVDTAQLTRLDREQAGD